MAKPVIHSKSSVKRYGGIWQDYFPIHQLIDSSKSAFADNRHRALTHNSWFIMEILERVRFPNSGPMTPDFKFPVIKNSDNKLISVRQIGEDHILEDFRNKFIPTVADYLNDLDMQPWHNNAMGGDTPPSYKKLKGGAVLKKLVKAKIAASEID